MMPEQNPPVQVVEHIPSVFTDDSVVMESIANQTFSAYENTFTFDHILRGNHARFDGPTPFPAPFEKASAGDEIYSILFSRVTDIIEKIVTFCKSIPGFKEITINDQMQMLKGATFEIVAVRAAFFLHNGCLVMPGDPHCILPLKKFKGTPLERVFGDIERVNGRLASLQLTGVEFSLVCGILVFSAGRLIGF